MLRSRLISACDAVLLTDGDVALVASVGGKVNQRYLYDGSASSRA